MHPGTMQARVELQGIAIELCDYDWPRSYAACQVEDRYVLGFSLTPPPPGSHARFDLPGSDSGEIGKLIFIPAGIPLIAGCDGGVQTIIRCCLTEERFNAIAGNPGEWTKQDLSASIDLKDHAMAQKLRQLVHEVEQPGSINFAYSEAIVQDLVFSLMRTLGRWEGLSHYTRGGLAGRQLKRIGERMMQADLAPPSVPELASMLGISARHLLRAFRASTGSSLRAHLDLVFKQRATRMLEESDFSISEIAARLGYRRVSSFSAAFHNTTGMAPSIHRAASRHLM